MFNILLQVLDDGRLTDNKGRTANFKNTIIIMTSNLGSQLIREYVSSHTQADGEMSDRDAEALSGQLMQMLKQTIRPEFLNRIDETIMFTPLTREQIADVVKLQIKTVQRMLEPQGIELQVTPHAIEQIADEGYDPEMGARPVKRAIQRMLLNDLSKRILADEVHTDRPITVDSFGEGLVFRN